MNPQFPLLKWLGTAQGITSLLLVVITACWLGSCLAQVYSDPPIPTYAPDFGKAKWITPDAAEGAAYFRKDLYVSQKVRHAWLMVTAPNDFVVFIDNTKIPGATRLARHLGVTGYQLPGFPTALIDMTPYLKPGTNTVAVYVMSSSYQNPACLRACGCVEYAMQNDEFVSDSSWRASSYPGVLNNLMSWTDPVLDDAHWPFARPVDYSDNGLVQPVAVPPALFQEPLLAHRICAFSKDPQVGMFSPEIDLPGGSSDCWMQIASVGDYQIIINGQPMADSRELAAPANWEGTDQRSYAGTVNFYWIQPWIKSGKNQITVRLASPRDTPTLVAQISYRNTSNQIVHVISDRSWTVKTLSGETEQALDLGAADDSGSAWNSPVRESSPGTYTASERNHRFIWNVTGAMLLALLFVAIHWLVADYIDQRGAVKGPQALIVDAVLHLPVLFFLIFLALLHFDAHTQFNWVNQPGPLWIILVAWFALRSWVIVSLKPSAQPDSARHRWMLDWIDGRGFAILLAIIGVFSFALRLSGIDLFSLNQDEMLMRYCAQGIWERGFPSTNYGGQVQRLTTYEFLTYPIALSGLIFGWSDWAVRIPALLFSAFTTWNLGRMGREMFSPAVGLLAAVCHAILPWNVYYAEHCVHPAQDQFFALLCFWSFYRAICVPGTVYAREYYKACVYFILTYLTWEGSAFILVAFGILLLLMQAGRWEWLRQFHMYAGLLTVIAVIVLQLSSRAIKNQWYLQVGYGLSSLTPHPVFLDQTETINYYVNGIMREQCHLLLSISLVFGLLFIGRSRPLRYVLVLFGLLLFLYSNFLPVQTVRYFYFYQSLLILGACATLVYACEAIYDMVSHHAVELARRVALWSTGGIVVTILLVSSTLGWQLIDVTVTEMSENPSTRYGLYWPDARAACRYVADHLQPGDGVTGTYNYSFFHFTGHWVDFTLNEDLADVSTFNPNRGAYGLYENNYIHVPALQTDRDFAKAFSRFKRLWYIGYISPSTDPDVIKKVDSYVIHRSRVVYSGFQVNVYLADGMAAKPGEQIPDLGLPPSPGLSSIDDETKP